MPDEDKRNPTTGTESDISKAQSQQQPPQQAKQQPETGEQRGQFETGQTGQAETGTTETGQPDEGLQGETATKQRTDIEGTAEQSPETNEAEGGFVGSESDADSSSELVEDQDFAKGGQGAPEGK